MSPLAVAAEQPKPVLSKDVHHKPKTTGSFGVLVVGLGGANGCTLLAGILANRLHLEWHGPRGEPQTTPNWYGCITQLKQKGGGVGYNDKVRGLADASMAAVGGWVSGNCENILWVCLVWSPACGPLCVDACVWNGV